jgi:uncharacterized membrane protein YciS (DUF1049 family)
MRSFIKGIILLPIAILVVLLAVANRHPVLISFDPFTAEAPEISLTLPLFAIIFAAVMLGVVVGGIGAWLSQADNRRARRQSQREASRLRAEIERARAYPASNVPALSNTGRV